MMRRILEIRLQAFQHRFPVTSIHLKNRSLFVTRFDVVNALHLEHAERTNALVDSFSSLLEVLGFALHRPLMLRQNV